MLGFLFESLVQLTSELIPRRFQFGCLIATIIGLIALVILLVVYL